MSRNRPPRGGERWGTDGREPSPAPRPGGVGLEPALEDLEVALLRFDDVVEQKYKGIDNVRVEYPHIYYFPAEGTDC